MPPRKKREAADPDMMAEEAAAVAMGRMSSSISRIVDYITKDCPSREKVVNTVAPGIRYSAATRSSAQGGIGDKI